MKSPVEDQQNLQRLKQAYQALEKMEARLRALEGAKTEPIAIVGMACRFPGGADTPEKLWRLLAQGVDAIGEVPEGRWPTDAMTDLGLSPEQERAVRLGGFLHDIAGFDAPFFEIAPREALNMDPQQRLMLEVAWEAIENAHQSPERLYGSSTGVFIGIGSTDYFSDGRGGREVNAYMGTGAALSVAAGRLSFTLGFTGPCLALDTACSSSLVAVHLACESLRREECRLALAGGTSLMLTPRTSAIFAKAGMLSPDGHCKTFDDAANGYARGEGCGCVVLKRLSDALADGDEILALIRGTAINQDGPSGGLTVPNGLSQQAVLRQALARAGIDPGSIDYVEAHGTGTSLGDPIEMRALGAVFGSSHSAERPLLVGTLKTNIGHLEVSAGIAGLMKLVLALQHGQIPPSVHFQRPSTHIPWQELPVQVPSKLIPWPEGGRPRMAGVSSFGFSGTNAHAVLEQAPPRRREPATTARPVHLLPLSARSEQALRDLARRHADRLAQGEGSEAASLPDICTTAALGRSHFRHRLAVVGADEVQIRQSLEGFAKSTTVDSGNAGEASADGPRIALLFTGQGSQYAGMGRKLYETEPTFHAHLDRCEERLRSTWKESLKSVLWGEHAHLLNETRWTQPALFALEFALAMMWQAWGIKPAVLMGHSVGEFAAACVAGVFSLEEGLELISARGRLMQELPRDGLMAAVFADEAEVRDALRQHAAEVSIAAINGPQQVVISGARVTVERLCEALAAKGLRSQRIPVSHAFHSPQMEPMLAPFEQVVRAVKLRPPQVRLVSNVTGTAARDELTSPGYWTQHSLAPVLFMEGIRTARQLGCEVFLEVGPKPTLLSLARQCLPAEEGVAWLPSLRDGQKDWQQVLQTLAELYVRGAKVTWETFTAGYGQRRAALPNYPFQRKRYWLEAASADRLMPGRAIEAVPSRHPLLGARLASPRPLFESRLNTQTQPFLADHRCFGQVVVPGAAFVEMALAAAHELSGGQPRPVGALMLQKALVLTSAEEGCTVQLLVDEREGGRRRFRLYSRAVSGEEEWTLHVSGTLDEAAQPPPPRAGALEDWKASCAERVEPAGLYRVQTSGGIEYGPVFQGMKTLWCGAEKALGQIELPQHIEVAGYRVHPALLDACFQLLGALLHRQGGAINEVWVPVRLERVHLLLPPGRKAWCGVTLRSKSADTLVADLELLDAQGALLGAVQGLHLQRTEQSALLGAPASESVDALLYQVNWEPQPLLGASAEEALHSPQEIQRRLVARTWDEPWLAELERVRGLPARLDELSLAYVVRAFQDLGLQPGGWSATTEELADDLGIVQQHRRLFGRLLGILGEAGLVQREGRCWQGLRSADMPAPQRLWEAMREQYPQAQAELVLLRRCAERLAAVLRETEDPLQLLFPGGDTTDATRVYESAPEARAMNALVGQALATALERLPGHLGLRVLEVGGGTGGTTSTLLPCLPAGRIEYVFTDISPVFVDKARERFDAFPFVRYRTLDIEASPLAQGFEPGGYHVIIAANVLHATRDMAQTLAHVRELLAPGGILLLLEGTEPQRWLDLTFGMTEGWWRFADHTLRPDYPLLSRERWVAALADAGLSQVSFLTPRVTTAQAVILAQAASAPTHVGPETAGGRRWLVLADRGGVGQQLAAALEARGERCRLLFRQIEQGEEDGRLIASALTEHLDWHGVVHLWSLDAAETEGLTRDALESSSALVCGSTLALVQALGRLGGTKPPSLWLVTRGAQAVLDSAPLQGLSQSSLWGMARVIAMEHPELACVRVDLDSVPGAGSEQIEALRDELLCRAGEQQVAFRRGSRLVPRLARYGEPTSERPSARSRPLNQPHRLEISSRGTLDSLRLAPVPRRAPGEGEIEICVQASGLNFMDVLDVLGLYPDPRPDAVGGECVGEVVAVGPGVDGYQVGDSVMALAPGSFGQYVTARVDLVAPRPPLLSAEEAATVPVAFLTAWYALHHKANMKAGQRVLIHAAAGGVGMAAVQLAQAVGAEVFATASRSKWQALRALGVKHIMDSRSLAFADEVKALTGGRGVDLVLNGLTGEFIPRSLSTLAPGGHFVEIGKRERDVWNAARFAELRPDVHYSTVDLMAVADQEAPLLRPMLQELAEAFRARKLSPLPHTAFALKDAAEAFRHMQQAKHIGKVVLVPPRPLSEPVRFRADASYWIAGGLGGLGLLVARWMAERGARHLALIARSQPNEAAREQIGALEQAGVRVAIVQADVSRKDEITRAAAELERTLPPVRGVIHSVGVLDDGVLSSQRWERFRRVFAPKVDGAWNLHVLLQGKPLDFFVLFSSATSLMGNPGQSNHAAANAFLDMLAFHRRALGLPGLSINWGVWADVGSAAARGVDQRLSQKGMSAFSPATGLQVLEALWRSHEPQVGVMPIQWPAFLADLDARGLTNSFYERFRDQARTEEEVQVQAALAPDLLRQIQDASASQRRALLTAAILERVRKIMSIDPSEPIGQHQPLKELGLDSLMAIELRNLLSTAIGQPLSATLLFKHPTISALTDHLMELLFPSAPAAAPPLAAQLTEASPSLSSKGGGQLDDLEFVEHLSEEELQRILGE